MEFGVADLAARSGVGVDTIRFYQAQGLLPGPERRGRRAVYGRAHLQRLERIRSLKAEGVPLRMMPALFEGGGSPTVKALRRELQHSRGGRRIERRELAERSGVPEVLLTAVEQAGLLGTEPGQLGAEPLYTETDIDLARAALAVIGAGFPLAELLDLARCHAEHIQQICDAAAELFERQVRLTPEGQERPAEETADRFRELLPAVTKMVAYHFQRTLVNSGLRRLEAHGDKAVVEVARQASQSGQVEVTWRE